MKILSEVRYLGKEITVQVTDVYDYNGQKKATVKALKGQPFTTWSHGGPVPTDTRNCRVEFLRNVRIPVELDDLATVSEQVNA